MLVLAGIGVMFWLISGDGEDAQGPGPVGPVGPQGNVGPQGQAGPQNDAQIDEAIAGSGLVTTEIRPIDDFDTVIIAGEGTVDVTVSGSPEVSVRTDDNLLPMITTEVRSGTLYLDKVEDVNDIARTGGVVFEVGTLELASLGIAGAGSITADASGADQFTIEISGAGNIDVTGLDGELLTVDGSGAGRITAAGRVDVQHTALGDALTYAAGDLESGVAVVETNGANSALIWVTDELDITMRGSGTLEYYGRPDVTSEIGDLGASARWARSRPGGPPVTPARGRRPRAQGSATR